MERKEIQRRCPITRFSYVEPIDNREYHKFLIKAVTAKTHFDSHRISPAPFIIDDAYEEMRHHNPDPELRLWGFFCRSVQEHCYEGWKKHHWPTYASAFLAVLDYYDEVGYQYNILGGLDRSKVARKYRPERHRRMWIMPGYDYASVYWNTGPLKNLPEPPPSKKKL